MSSEAAEVPDRTIASLAIIKVNFDHRMSFIENFGPFLRHCLARSKSDLISAPDLQRSIAEEFGLEFPQAILTTLLHREERGGNIIREYGVCRKRPGTFSDADLEAQRLEASRRHAILIMALVAYAQQAFQRTWSDEYARDVLMTYLEEYSTAVLAAAVSREALSSHGQSLTGDSYIVHRFALHAVESDHQSFEFLEVVVKGKMLADSVYLGQREFENRVAPLAKLEVYFDGPILLYLLGYAGQEIAAPHGELLALLKEQGAILRCFKDSVVEAERILHAAASKAAPGDSGDHLHGNVVTHLVHSKMSASDIELLADKLQRVLLRMGVQTVERPPAAPRFTFDDACFERLLTETYSNPNRRALRVDVDAVAAIHRLRYGQADQSLDRTRAVFVSHNSRLVNASASFFDHQPTAGAIPHCVHISAFTTLVWLRQPLLAPQLPRDCIIADAFAAMNPSDQLWGLYNHEIDRLRERDLISDESAHILRVSEESRQVLMDKTLGDESAYVEGTAMEVLEHSREEMTLGLLAELQDEQLRREEVERALLDRNRVIEERGQWVGRFVARAFFTGLVPLLFIGLVVAAVGPFNTTWAPLPSSFQIFCAVIVVLLTLASIVAGMSISSLAERVAASVERVAVAIIRRLGE